MGIGHYLLLVTNCKYMCQDLVLPSVVNHIPQTNLSVMKKFINLTCYFLFIVIRRTTKRKSRKASKQFMLEIRKLVDEIQKNGECFYFI